MAKKIDLSIVIVNYNTMQLLKNCLDSLLTINELKSYEIIIVDNHSTDGSIQLVNSLTRNRKIIKLIKNKENLGYAKANNQALQQAEGKYVLFLNSDTLVPKKTIPMLENYLDHHPQVGAITPRLELRNGQIDPDCHRGFPQPWASFCYFTGLEKLFPGSKIFGQYHLTWKRLDAVHQIDACCGAFLLTRKKILDEINGFDEKYFFYGEDLDLCYRIKQKGWRIVYFPKVKAMHYKGASSGLRQESRDIACVDRETRERVALASIEAMEIFYDKFYRKKYPRWINFLVKIGMNFQKSVRLNKASD